MKHAQCCIKGEELFHRPRPDEPHSSSITIQSLILLHLMDNDTIKTVATVVAGLGLAAVAIRASQKKPKTGRESWNPKTDFSEYDYIIAGGQFPFRCRLGSRVGPNVRCI